MKRFGEWMGLKSQLHNIFSGPPFVMEGEIWWISVGENVGREINGKNRLFSRPAIILKKLAHDFYFVIPTTTKIRIGTWYVPFERHEQPMVACLHQARAIDHRRLSSRLGMLKTEDFLLIKNRFHTLYK